MRAPPEGRSLHIGFLNSWHTDSARGSGTAVGITGLASGLESLGHRVTFAEPRQRGSGGIVSRFIYNAGLGARRCGDGFDLVVGFDIDGCFYRPGPRQTYVVCLKGISAEELTFESGGPRAQLWFLSRLERRNARRASKVLVTSEHSRRAALAAYGLDPARVAAVPEGIDLALWENASVGSPPPRSGPPVILSVARQYPRKNTRTLLAAMPAVRAAFPGVHLRVVGGGPMLPALRDQADRLGLGGAVEFLGEMPDDEAVRREYLGADIFCLPSRQEGFGIVYLEAMAAGLPIVASDAAAIPEVIPDGEAALLVPPLDAEALGAALVRLLGNGALRARLGAAGKARVRRYAWPEVARAFLRAVEGTGERENVGSTVKAGAGEEQTRRE